MDSTQDLQIRDEDARMLWVVYRTVVLDALIKDFEITYTREFSSLSTPAVWSHYDKSDVRSTLKSLWDLRFVLYGLRQSTFFYGLFFPRWRIQHFVVFELLLLLYIFKSSAKIPKVNCMLLTKSAYKLWRNIDSRETPLIRNRLLLNLSHMLTEKCLSLRNYPIHFSHESLVPWYSSLCGKRWTAIFF